MNDPEGRRTVADLIAERRNERLFHVGRLDTDSEGLLILTNDGDFAHRLAHPSYQVPKTYIAEVAGAVGEQTLKRLRRGITLEDGPVQPTSVKIVSTAGDKTLLKITIAGGSESHCAPYDGSGRPSGPPAVADRNRTGPAREPESRGVPGPDP